MHIQSDQGMAKDNMEGSIMSTQKNIDMLSLEETEKVSGIIDKLANNEKRLTKLIEKSKTKSKKLLTDLLKF